ncbi:MAG: hypothetical protein JKY94_15145 [Rhodobacteraceae bacterium]|nr:hypothetical protein [Paracoccaceae bacterium]
MFKIKYLLLSVVLLSIPTWALSWYAWNRYQVFPVSDSVFEVVERPGSTGGANHYWCGAGDYAQRVLKTKTNQKIYIWKAIGKSVTKPGARAVQFSLNAPANPSASPGYSLSVKAVGDSLSTAAAQRYCYDNMDRECLVGLLCLN